MTISWVRKQEIRELIEDSDTGWAWYEIIEELIEAIEAVETKCQELLQYNTAINQELTALGDKLKARTKEAI